MDIMKRESTEAEAERRSRLKTLIKEAPQSPGVYLMRDETGEIIYVGKAKSLKNRLSSYFSAKRTSRPDTSSRASTTSNGSSPRTNTRRSSSKTTS